MSTFVELAGNTDCDRAAITLTLPKPMTSGAKSWRPRSLLGAGAVDDRVHGHVRDRRHDRRADGRAAGRLPAHNSVFLIAHFHNVIIGGVVFGAMCGYNYRFPKAFGFKLDERWAAPHSGAGTAQLAMSLDDHGVRPSNLQE